LFLFPHSLPSQVAVGAFSNLFVVLLFSINSLSRLSPRTKVCSPPPYSSQGSPFLSLIVLFLPKTLVPRKWSLFFGARSFPTLAVREGVQTGGLVFSVFPWVPSVAFGPYPCFLDGLFLSFHFPFRPFSRHVVESLTLVVRCPFYPGSSTLTPLYLPPRSPCSSPPIFPLVTFLPFFRPFMRSTFRSFSHIVFSSLPLLCPPPAFLRTLVGCWWRHFFLCMG